MKIHLEQLGTLEQADFDLGDMTIICGENNTGKTYANYAAYGFLHGWRRHLNIPIENKYTDALMKQGFTHMDPYTNKAKPALKSLCENYTQTLPTVFASKETFFNNSKFQISIESDSIHQYVPEAYQRTITFGQRTTLTFHKKAEETTLAISLQTEEGADIDWDNVHIRKPVIKEAISRVIGEIFFSPHFPHPFIASAERTGAAIFRKELDFARNRLLKELSKSEKDEINPFELLSKSHQDYALPVETNVEFTRKLHTITKQDSFLTKEHAEVLSDFSDIIGGNYISDDDIIYFKPLRSRVKLPMGQSSSAVRSLLDIGFYLRHQAKKGDLLMVDEPELNLHPKNQCRIARLFARLVNLGIKVFITTHSDYIIKELNTLLMLSREGSHIERIMQTYNYDPQEIISPNQIKAYIAGKAQIQLNDSKSKSKGNTLIPMEITVERGMHAPSFDETIDNMNTIQDDIIYGHDFDEE